MTALPGSGVPPPRPGPYAGPYGGPGGYGPRYRPHRHYWWILPIGVLIAVFAVVIVAWVVAAGPVRSGGTPIFWPFFPFGIFLLLFVVLFAVRAATWGGGWRGGYGGGPGRGWAGPGSARQILRMRYARGEITSEQFQQMDRELRESGGF